ncbi:MAG: hypothetical protein ACNI3C_05960 [Candidatus Marinarcus sp.]|uniref:hypothetical protein n=1 Tax=Candidatus Marinarcus sp. TaxID=3100987 RepID=UPI003B0075C0
MKIKCFEDYPNNKFKLIAVNEINCQYPHRYKVIFQDIDSLEKYEELLLPEELRGKYILGNVYSNYALEHENRMKIEKLFVPKKKVTSKNSFQIKKYIRFPNDIGIEEGDAFYNQKCYFYETKRYIYMIPNYVVANRYYFVSSSIKNALSNGSFSTLYYEESGFKFIGDTLYIKTKKTLKDEQVPLIARMITNEISKKNFMFFYKQTTHYKEKYKHIDNLYIPIHMGFPFEDHEDFIIQCKIIHLGNVYSKDNFETFDERDVILITHIYGDTIPYNFKNLKHEVYKENTTEETKKIDPDEPKKIPKKDSHITGKITEKKPSDKHTTSKESFKVENIYDFSEINIQKNEIIQNNIRTTYEVTDEEVDESLDRPGEGSGNNRVKQKLLDDDITKNSFKIENFFELFESFIDNNKIEEFSISEIIDLDNFEESNINKFFIDFKKEVARRLIYGYFNYKNIIINFIEVEHNIYWKKNTWYFISTEIFSESQVQTMLNINILKNQTNKQMLEDVKAIGASKFFMTKHDGIDMSEEKIKLWRKNLELGIKRYTKIK